MRVHPRSPRYGRDVVDVLSSFPMLCVGDEWSRAVACVFRKDGDAAQHIKGERSKAALVPTSSPAYT